MKKLTISIAFLLLAITFPTSHAVSDVYIHVGFVDGNEFLSFKNQEKEKYAMGLIDGLLLAPFLGAPKSNLSWFEQCVTGMNSNQIVAILDNNLAKNPAKWHQSMNYLSYVALKESCNY